MASVNRKNQLLRCFYFKLSHISIYSFYRQTEIIGVRSGHLIENGDDNDDLFSKTISLF